MGDFKQAIKDFDQSFKIAPGFLGFYNSRGKAYLKMEELSDALKAFSKSMKLDPGNERNCGAEPCLYLAMIKFRKRNQKKPTIFLFEQSNLTRLLS
jgi:tetratricopeptide (TPR) repeat protein